MKYAAYPTASNEESETCPSTPSQIEFAKALEEELIALGLSEVELDKNLETKQKGLYVIGDGSGVTHSLSHASASGVYVARHILEEM